MTIDLSVVSAKCQFTIRRRHADHNLGDVIYGYAF